MDANVRLKPVKPRARIVRAPWGGRYWTVQCRLFSGVGATLTEAFADWRMRTKLGAT